MNNQLRVAFIAIRMAPGPRTGDPQAVVIGTMDAWKQNSGDGATKDWSDGEDWRYACYPLSTLRGLIANSTSLDLSGKSAIFIGSNVLENIKDCPDGRLTKTDRGGLDELGFKKKYLDTELKVTIDASNELKLSRRQTAIPLRDVERVFFFAHDAWYSDDKSPFAAFDCARVRDPADADTQPHPFEAGIPKKEERHTGSRLILFPDFTDPSRPGALAAFSAHLEIKVAINGHNLSGDKGDVAPDRFDTRMLLDIGVRGGVDKSLWLTDAAKKPEPRRGLRFDKMRLSCSLAPKIPGWWWRSDPIELLDADLLEFALDDSTRRWNADYELKAHYVPALAALGFSKPNRECPISVRREFGFRALKSEGARDEDIVKIGWRFELRVYGFSDTFLEHPVVSAVVPNKVKEELKKTQVLFAEEQRRDDITLNPLDSRSSQTILTARLHNGIGVMDQVITSAALAALNRSIATVHGGLKSVHDGRPISLLPVFREAHGNLPVLEKAHGGLQWHVVGAAIDSTPGVLRPDVSGFQSRGQLRVWLTTFEPRMRFNMWGGMSDDKRSDVNPLSAEATFARLETTDRAYPRYMVDLHAQKKNMSGGLEPTAKPAFQPLITMEDPGSVVPGMRLGLEINKYLGTVSARGDKVEPPEASGAIVMIGALQLALGNAFDAAVTSDTAGWLIFRPLASERDADPDQLSASIDALVKLPITSVEPASEDDPQQSVRASPRKRRLPGANDELPDPDAPLLLPLDDLQPSQGGKPALTLSGEEVVTRDQDHTIGLSLRSVVTGRGTPSGDDEPRRQRVLVIEPRPFRIAAIGYTKLESLATAESSEVAVWNASGEGGLSWRVRDDGQVVDLVLPPQVIGEAMEKNRSGVSGRPKDIEPAKPAAARFGSLTVIKVDPTYANTRFREPGWNLRRILGFALQRSPGARLLDLRMELLYGLIARLRADDVWLTEIAGAVGEPAGPLTDTPPQLHLQKHFRLVNALLEAEKRRIAVEKLWRSRPDDELHLDDGVSFQIRRRMLENNELVGGPATRLRWPVPGVVPDDPGGLIDKSILDATFAANDRDEYSFPGGLSWAVESANILMSVYGRPHSSEGGSVRGVHLSALGGYGSQRALFDNRKSIMESDTTQARVQRYRLERIGRIACLWHPAKHVIVIERTVVPPAQFYNRPPIGLRQDEHLGRAILRKVKEYIEILKPQRRYPEDGTSLRERGFVLGAEFKSLKIHVDSAWGSDVRSEGWQIPIWDARFIGLAPKSDDPDDPANIYPKPQVRIILAGEGGREFPQEIDEPEKLYFYSSVVEGEDDNTDSWKPVRDVDFCDLPSPVVARGSSKSADLTDAMLPPEPGHVPGFERFTLALVPTKDAVAITHGRVPGGPVAALRNVTIARSSAQGEGNEEAAVEFGRGLAAKAANVRAEIDRCVGQVLGELEKLDRDTDQTKLVSSATALITQALNKINASTLGNAIRAAPYYVGDTKTPTLNVPKLNASCSGLSANLTQQVKGQLNRLVIIANDVLKHTAAAINERIDSATGVAGAGLDRLKVLKEKVDGVKYQLDQSDIDKARRLVEEEAKKLLSQLSEDKEKLQIEIDDAKGRMNQLGNDLVADLQQLQIRTRPDLGGLRILIAGGLEASSAALDGLDSVAKEADKVSKQLMSAGAKINQSCIAAAASLRKEIENRRPVLRKAMDDLVGSNVHPAARRILQALDMALVALLVATSNIEKGGVGQSLNALRDAFEKAKEGIDSVKERISLSSSGIQGVEMALGGVLDAAFKGANNLITQIIVSQITVSLDGLMAKLNSALILIESEINSKLIPNISNADLSQLNDLVDKLAKVTQPQLANVENELKSVVGEVEGLTQALTDKLNAARTAVMIEIDKAASQVEAAENVLIGKLSPTCEAVDGFVNKILGGGANAAAQLNEALLEAIDVDGLHQKLTRDLITAISSGAATIAGIKASVSAKAAQITAEAEARGRQLAGVIQESVRDLTGGEDLAALAQRANGVYQKGDTALRALRALGDPPKSGSLGFNRPEVAYVLGQASKIGVDMTPTLALVNRTADQLAAVETAGKAVGELLDSFGLRLPCSEIADQLLPDKLKGLSVSDLIPDMGGIDFKGLLQRVGFPDLDDSKAIQIRHGFDKATMRTWMEADLNVPFSEPVPLLSMGPVKVIIDTAKFSSQARLSVGVDGTERKMSGRIFGDWRIDCSGQTMLTFRKTELLFDERGKIDFRIQPDRVEVAEALRFITDLMAATGKKGGLQVQPLLRGGIPSGVAASLDLALPPVQTGAFGISDLSLHILFGIAVLPRFEIVSELSIGTRMAPFTLNIWIFNGGGYLMQRLSFQPMAKPQPLMRYTLDIGVLAGLGLGISFGVISGGVWAQVGCAVAFTWVTGGQGTATAIRVFLLLRGNVDVAGLITASIALLIEMTYDGNRIIGAGTLTISAKISMFYTLSVTEHIEYVFAGEPKGGDKYADAYC